MNRSALLTPLVALVALMFAQAHAAPLPVEAPWHAQWIGPAVPAVDLTAPTPEWIWFPEKVGNPLEHAPAGSRFFRHTLTIPAGAPIRAATAIMTADNHFDLWVNGKQAGRGNDWNEPQRIDLKPFLTPGDNILAVEAVNDISGGPINAAGLAGLIRIDVGGEHPLTLVTNTSWKASDTRSDGWQNAALNDTTWKPALSLGQLGIQPWGGVSLTREHGLSNLWTCYRKSFTLSTSPSSALARIAVDSRYWLWVNGKPVVFEGGLKRGPTPNDTYYDQVDLGPYLTRGTNTLAILTWYWGRDGFSHKSSGKPGLVFEMDAGAAQIRSDESWKAKIHPAYSPASGPEPNYRLPEHSVHFDARNDIAGWTAPGWNDSGWEKPMILGIPPAAPWNHLVLRPIPQWKNSGLQDYANSAAIPAISTGEPIAAKLPYNAQITPWLSVDAPAGLTIDMRTDDPLNEIHSEYVTRAGAQEWESFAWMNGHSVIYHIPKGVKILSLKYRETGFNTDFTGEFNTDQDFYNRLWTKCRRTLYVTMRDNFMDCPDRERGQWWGDAVNELGEAFYALSPSSSRLTRKAILNLCEWQRPDKTLFAPVPAGNWNQELPPQMLASVGKYGFWTYYVYTGDLDTLQAAYPHVQDYLSLWKIDADGLIVHRAGDWDWEDWGDNIDARLLDNTWFSLALEAAANMAEVLGRKDEAAAYRTRRGALIAAVNRHFWSDRGYRTPRYTGATDDRGNGLAVVAGIAGPAQFPTIRKVLAAEYHASPYMEKYVLEALFQMEDADAALARMKQRYDPMVANNLTTLMENWDGGSQNHAWSGGPLTLLSQYAAGIKPLTPGYDTYEVRPQMGTLKHIHAAIDSVKGKIDLDLGRDTGRFTLKLASPPGASATVCVPLGVPAITSISVNGHILWPNAAAPVPGVAFKDMDGPYARFTAGPGNWEFVGE